MILNHVFFILILLYFNLNKTERRTLTSYSIFTRIGKRSEYFSHHWSSAKCFLARKGSELI